MIRFVSCCALLVCSVPSGFSAPQEAANSPTGTVGIPITCDPAVRGDFDSALGLLHSFFYEEARRRFLDITERDPDCAMAWWGLAMTYYHPVWAGPTPEEFAAGAAAARRAKAIEGVSQLESGFIDAIDAYYRTAAAPPTPDAPIVLSCHGERVRGPREAAFLKAWTDLSERYPDDVEVAAFQALALIGSAPPDDTAYKNQLLAGAILEPLFETHPDHPGVAHYLIHAYDYPGLAARALPAARVYGDVAPWVPHALHMPSHVFTRLGMWPESIKANVASAEAARAYAAEHHGGGTWYDELHALDYLVFAYMQTAQDDKAAEIVERVRANQTFVFPNFAAAYAIGAIPARYALERHDWQQAAALPIIHEEIVAPYPFAAAHTEFARAVGAARCGKLEDARAGIARLAALRDALQDSAMKWWIDQIEIQRLSASAWLAHAEGDDAAAERLLRAAAGLEDRAGIHPVTPGQLLPAHEQLGDLLLALGRQAQAQAEYEATLAAFPGRFHAHLGVARAAEALGRTAVARQHYEQLIAMAGAGSGHRSELAHAHAFLDED